VEGLNFGVKGLNDRFIPVPSSSLLAEIAQSVQRLATGWTVRVSNPDGARFSAPVQTGPGAQPVSYITGTGSFPGVKRTGRGVDYPPHLLTRLKKEYSYTSTPPLGLRELF
jgi:hypothetical protein